MAQLVFNYNFKVTVQNVQLGFTKISGIARNMEAFTYTEGGLNEMVHVFPNRVKNAGTLHMEAGVVLGATSPFLRIGTGIETMRIDVLTRKRRIAKTYIFKNLVITKWELGELDASSAGVLIDKFEVMYGEVYVDI